MKLELLKAKIEKEKLLKVPASERAFYLKAMNFLTDVNIIHNAEYLFRRCQVEHLTRHLRNRY